MSDFCAIILYVNKSVCIIFFRIHKETGRNSSQTSNKNEEFFENLPENKLAGFLGLN